MSSAQQQSFYEKKYKIDVNYDVDYSSFSLGIFLEIHRYENDEFIVGIPDCGGWALEYSKDGLRFGVRCKYMYNIGNFTLKFFFNIFITIMLYYFYHSYYFYCLFMT
jgi:hypothetical protein